MEIGRFLCLLFLVSLTSFLPATEGYKFYVGGKDGWVLKPSESYSHWTERNRFQVNDTLYFKYNNGSDSVLVVDKDNFYNCNTSNPIQKLEDGNSEFKFDRSGPFYFISGKDGACANGQKLIIIVLAVRHSQTPPSAAPPQGSPPAPSTAPSSTPSSAPSTNPVTSPVPAPASATTPTTSSPPSPVGTAPTPSGDVPSGDVTSPPPGSNQNSTAPNNGAYGVTASSVLVSSVVVLVSMVFMSSFY